MKKLFITAAKFMGIYFVFQGVVAFGFMGGLSATTVNLGYNDQTQMAVRVLSYLIPMLTILVGLFFIIYPEKLADLVGVRDSSAPVEISAAAFLRIGMVLIGLQYVLNILRGSVMKIAHFFSPDAIDAQKFNLGDLISIICALILVFKADTIAAYLERKKAS